MGVRGHHESQQRRHARDAGHQKLHSYAQSVKLRITVRNCFRRKTGGIIKKSAYERASTRSVKMVQALMTASTSEQRRRETSHARRERRRREGHRNREQGRQASSCSLHTREHKRIRPGTKDGHRATYQTHERV